MPPRWCTLAIIGFWLITTAWFVVREVLPRWRVGQPPPFALELTDEVSTQPVNWKVFLKGQDVGKAQTIVQRLPDRTFSIQSKFDCRNVLLLDSIQLSSIYHVNHAGDLLDMVIDGKIGIPLLGQLHGEVKAKIVGGYCTPELVGKVAGKEERFRLDKIKVPGNIFNSMQAMSRIPGLHEGQEWTIPHLDPLQLFAPGFNQRKMNFLEAGVSRGTLTWEGEETTCHIIDYREPGKTKAIARTWVRHNDGLVLQHLATHEILELVLQRVPNK